LKAAVDRERGGIEMETMAMVKSVDVHLPDGWSLVEYSELNHHITFIDNLGRTVRLDAEKLVKYSCDNCGREMFAKEDHGQLKCECGQQMTIIWGQAQLCFVPKQEHILDG